MTRRLRPTARATAGAQAAVYGTTGVWPLLSPGTFQAVTGPKADMWLAKTFGLLVTAVGGALAAAAHADRVTPEIRLLGIGSAAALAAADVWYVARGRIKPTYLADAAVEAALVAAWTQATPAPR